MDRLLSDPLVQAKLEKNAESLSRQCSGFDLLRRAIDREEYGKMSKKTSELFDRVRRLCSTQTRPRASGITSSPGQYDREIDRRIRAMIVEQKPKPLSEEDRLLEEVGQAGESVADDISEPVAADVTSPAGEEDLGESLADLRHSPPASSGVFSDYESGADDDSDVMSTDDGESS
jgi:hypothetical protein